MIELIGLTKKYKKDKDALKGINVCFEEKGLYFLTGKSGSGKSTLLNILSGIDLNYEGKMIIDGKDFKSFSNKEINYYRGTYVGYVFQDYNLIKDLTVYENLKLACDISRIDYKEIDIVLEKLGILELKDKSSKEISGGEAQRVAIARCLIKHPKVILADEPTGALDNENGEIIMNLLAELSLDYTVIIVTHNTTYLDKYNSHNYLIESGCINSNTLVNNSKEYNFICEKTNKLSSSLVFSFSKKTILKRRNGLVTSLFFIIISIILLSVSISGITYNPYYSAYETLLSNDDYIVSRNGRRGDFTSSNPFSKDYINEISSTVDDNFVYGYQYSAVSLDGNESIRDYYKGYSKNDYYNTDGLAFEYNQKSIDLFEIKVLVGNEPVLEGECAVSDTLADTFIEVNYKNNDVEYGINSYSDLIGLKLFGYKITSVVSCKKSEEYRKYFRANEKTRYAGSRLDDSIYSGTGNSIFISKNLTKTSDVLVSYSVPTAYYDIRYKDDEVYGQGIVKLKGENTSSNINYLEGYNQNSSGLVIGASVALESLSRENYNEFWENGYYYNKNQHSDWDENKLVEETTKEVKDFIFERVNNLQIDFRVTPSLSADFVDYKKALVIGIDFANLENIYVDDYFFAEDIEYISNFVNIDAIFHKATSSKNCRLYAYGLMKSYMKDEGNDAHNASYYIQSYLDFGDVFKILLYIFMSLGIIFLCIGVFITYKQISGSIIKIEKDFGVLKSMGVTSFDIFRILNIQNIIISIFAIILSCLIQYIGVFSINKLTSLYLQLDSYFKSYHISCLNYLVIIFMALIVPVLVSIRPIIECSMRSPKDILNNN